MMELDAQAKEAGITVMNEIGVDPGVDHQVAPSAPGLGPDTRLLDADRPHAAAAAEETPQRVDGGGVQ